MTVKFTNRTKQDRLDLMPGVPLAFEDDRAEAYFVAAGWAETTDEKPTATYPAGSVNIDPETTFSGTTNRVLEG